MRKSLVLGLKDTHTQNILNIIKPKYNNVDFFDIINGVFIDYKGIIKNITKQNSVYTSRLINFLFIYKNIKNYDSIIFLFFKYEYYFLIPFLSKISHKKIIVFYGSDFYGNPLKKVLKFILRKVDNIYIVTPHLFRYFNEYYRDEFNYKSKMLYLIPDFLFFLFKYPIINIKKNDNKYNVMIGTTGHPLENHEPVLKVFEANPDLANYIKIFIHVGYKVNNEEMKYVNEIKHKLTHLNSIYEIDLIDKFLSYQELADLRYQTDILINNRVFDQFSGGMLESLYCGAFVLNGSWLPYQYHKDLGIYFESYDKIEDIIPKIWDYITNNKKYKEKLIKNTEIIEHEFNEEVIKSNWLKILD